MKSKFLPKLTRVAALNLVLLMNFGLASAQTAQFCPDADKFYREAGVIDLECTFRQAVVSKYNAELTAVNQTLATPGLPTTTVRKYTSEKSTLTSRLRSAQRTANTVCANLASRLKSGDTARAKCNGTPTPTPTGTATKTPTPTPTPTVTPTPNPTTTAYCPLGTYTVVNAGGSVGVCKRGKIYNNGCYYVEEEYHQNPTTFNAALANPRLAVLWAGYSNGMYQINFAALLAGVPQSACVN